MAKLKRTKLQKNIHKHFNIIINEDTLTRRHHPNS